MFSQTVEYALRAVVALAQAAPESRTTRQIAHAMQLPHAFLFKILQNLDRAGVVRARRGHRGGVSLARDPAEITILEVVQAVDPIRRIADCPLGLVAHGVRLCPLHRRMDAALAGIEEAFGQTTLAEILAETAADSAACPFPSETRRPSPRRTESCRVRGKPRRARK